MNGIWDQCNRFTIAVLGFMDNGTSDKISDDWANYFEQYLGAKTISRQYYSAYANTHANRPHAFPDGKQFFCTISLQHDIRSPPQEQINGPTAASQ